MKCPLCGGTNFTTWEYDFGRCPETGYHDAGERYRCFDCRSEGDVDELIQDDEETASHPLRVRQAKGPSHISSVGSVGWRANGMAEMVTAG